MNGLFAVLIFGAFSTEAQQHSSNVQRIAPVNKIVKTFDKLSLFEEAYEKAAADDSGDSILKYNNKLTSLLLHRELLRDADLKEISSRTEIKVCRSKDGKVNVLSWTSFIHAQAPTCSNIVWFDSDAGGRASRGAAVWDDFGADVETDTVIDITKEGKTFYLFIGTGKCGVLCLKNKASIYSIRKDRLEKCLKVFFDGHDYVDDIEFEYELTSEIAGEPAFHLEKNDLSSPVFDTNGGKLLGTKTYHLILH